MKTIFDSENMPGRRFKANLTFENTFQIDGEAVCAARSNIRNRIAQVCADDDDLVKITANANVINVSANCVILTEDELASLLEKQFSAGVEYERYSRPIHHVLKIERGSTSC